MHSQRAGHASRLDVNRQRRRRMKRPLKTVLMYLLMACLATLAGTAQTAAAGMAGMTAQPAVAVSAGPPGSDVPPSIKALEAAADAATAKRDYLNALTAYRTILLREPSQRAALLGTIRSLARLGAPQLALELAGRHPGLLAAGEHDAIAADYTAQKIRWGAIAADTGRGPERFAAIDAALAGSEAAAARALDPAAALNDVERQLVLDRITALRERYRMRDAVVLYEAVAARPAPVRAYAKSAAASAYLYLEQPERARDLYREALRDDPGNLETRLGLFFALAESEQHDAALLQAESTLAATPPTIDAWSAATLHENPAYARALGARSMAPLFANQPGEAWQRLRALSARAPYNMDIRTDYASSMRAREWPRQAEEELRWILAVDPDHGGALGERAGALLEMRDYRHAATALTQAQAVAAEDGRVKRAARLLSVHDLRELVIDGTYGRSSGGPSGTQDYAVDTRLYSSPIGYQYRAFGHLYNAQARLSNGTARRERAGVGLEYRSPLIIASGELAQGVNGGDAGAAVSVAVTPDDHWTLRGTAATSANETPLQAHLAGIAARRIAVEAVWQAHESRSAALSHAQMRFGDGNRRDTTQARWTERVIAGPVYKLEVTGALYGSRNSLAGAPYFNPARDFSPTLELANEWLQWRRYTRAFRHRVVVAAGRYAQQGFATGTVTNLRYEQEWQADDRLTIRYGIGRSRHPYDGVQTLRNYGTVSLNWRF